MTIAASVEAPAPAGAQGWRVLAVLSALLGFATISTDFYLPALPTMALGQLLWGPIGDRYGIRGPVAVALVLFVIGSAGCALSNSVPALIGWRVVQALGACANVVLARAMVRDLYAGDRAAQVMSTLMTVMAVASMLVDLQAGAVRRDH